MKYLKVFTDFGKSIQPLSDAEKGRLFAAMLEYAETSAEPQFTGNERFVWPTAKLHIDREAAFCEKQRRNASKPNEAKPSQTKPNEAKPSQTCQKDKDKDKEYKETLPNGSAKKTGGAVFSPPTVEMVKAYCQERGNRVDPQRFVDFYASKGWKVGNQPMKDWRAAVRTWERSESKMSSKQQDYHDKWHPKSERSGAVAQIEDIELKLEDL